MNGTSHEGTIKDLFAQIQAAMNKDNERTRTKTSLQTAAANSSTPATTAIHTPLFGGSQLNPPLTTPSFGGSQQLHASSRLFVESDERAPNSTSAAASARCLTDPWKTPASSLNPMGIQESPVIEESSSPGAPLSEASSDDEASGTNSWLKKDAKQYWQSMRSKHDLLQAASAAKVTKPSVSLPTKEFCLGSCPTAPSRRRGPLTTPLPSQVQSASKPVSSRLPDTTRSTPSQHHEWPALRPPAPPTKSHVENSRGTMASSSSPFNSNLDSWINSRRRHVSMYRPPPLSVPKSKPLSWNKPTFQLGGVSPSVSTSSPSPSMSTSSGSKVGKRSRDATPSFTSSSARETYMGLGKRKSNDDSDPDSLVGFQPDQGSNPLSRPYMPGPGPYGSFSRQFTAAEADSIVAFADKWIPTDKKRRKMF